MESINKNLSFKIVGHFDVVIAGAGCAGVTAAIAAGRLGVSTLLVERASYPGGMLTGGLVHSLHGYRLHKDYVKKTPMSSWETPLLLKGITMEILQRLQEEHGTIDQDHYGDPSVRENFDAEIMKYVLDEMLKEAGVTVLYDTFVLAPTVENKRVTGLMITNKSGPQIINASVVIDATGDGDVAAAAGADFEIGYDGDPTTTHGVSMLMEVGGIDVERLLSYLRNRPKKNVEQYKQERINLINGGEESPSTILKIGGESGSFNMKGKALTWDEIEKAKSRGQHLILPGIINEWIEYLKQHPEIPYMPNTKMPKPCYPHPPKFSWYGIIRHGKIRYDQMYTGVHEMLVDQCDGNQLSDASVRMRKINHIYMDFFRTMIPGFENAYIIQTSPMIGTRESRRIIGRYTLTTEDCVYGRTFKDAIAYCGRALNVHQMNGQGGLWYWIEPEKAYTLPYRMLLPKDIEGLLVAGRCASVEFVALGGVRSMPSCMSLGEAAGVAAALSATNGIAPSELSVMSLQEHLRSQGVLLPDWNVLA